MAFGTMNLLSVYIRTNGLNSVAISVSALKEVIKDIELGEDFTLYTIFDWIISVTSISAAWKKWNIYFLKFLWKSYFDGFGLL